jgi:hypothetical protein
MRSKREIVVGEFAYKEKRLLQECNVGRINARYRIIKLGDPERYFIVDFANPRKLKNYGPISLILPLITKNENKVWSAWEVTKKDLVEIQYKPYKSSTWTHAAGASLGLALSQVGRVAFFEDGVPPALFVAFSVGLFLLLLFSINISTFRPDKYPAAQIVGKENQKPKVRSNNVRAAIAMLVLFVISLGVFTIAVAFFNISAVITSATIFFIIYTIFEKFFFKHPKIERDATIEDFKPKRTHRVSLQSLRKRNRKSVVE